MAKRPEMLSEEVFRESLHEQGCHPKYVDAYLGDCKLLVPLLIREVGETRFFAFPYIYSRALGYYAASLRVVPGGPGCRSTTPIAQA